MLDVYVRETSVQRLVALAGQLATSLPLSKSLRSTLAIVPAMLVIPAQEGYIFAAISHPDATHRYRIEVIRLAA